MKVVVHMRIIEFSTLVEQTKAIVGGGPKSGGEDSKGQFFL